MSFIFFSIFVIFMFQEFFVQYFFNKNSIFIPNFINKYILRQSTDVINKKSYNNAIYINIVNKCLCIDDVTKKLNKYNYLVLRDDALNDILIKNSNGINSSEIVLLIQQYPILKNIRKGQMLSWLVIANQHLQSLILNFSSQEVRVYNRVHINFSESIIRTINSLNDKFSNKILFIGTLNGTFIESARSLGIEESYITDIINALRYQLDFRKLHQGDRFAILVSVTIDDDYDIQTKFIGARVCTTGKNYYVFCANNGKFYDHKAVRLGTNNFIPFPISRPFRISSNFNLHRLNPITKRICPHAGVDFAVPIGTPVFSVGDGEIITSAYSKIAGNYVVVRHNHKYITRYMHLKKLLVRPGQKVRCGDNIALSGNTGRSTGPHLHFEVWVDRRPVDPLTFRLLNNTEKLLGNDRIIYLNQISTIISQLHFN